LKATHETEVFTLNSAHSKEIQKLKARTFNDEIRQIREEFKDAQAVEIQQAANKAAAHTRAMMFKLEEIRSLEASNTHQKSQLQANYQQELAKLASFWEAERKKAVQEAVGKAKSEHAAETAAFVTRQREDLMKRADGELRTLSDAHSSKTASLEIQVETKSKELDTVRVELEQTKKKLKNMAEELAKYNLLDPLLHAGGNETPLSELD
jgi:hypothetical protein